MEIKNCPVCGEVSEYFELTEVEGPVNYKVGCIRCDRCHYSIKYAIEDKSKEEIISFWNDLK